MTASGHRDSWPHPDERTSSETAPLECASADTTVAEARAAVAAYLQAHCAWVHAPGVILVVSELISNAVRHAGGWWRLRVRADGELLTLEVEDLSPLRPEPREPDYGGEGGLGLHIVARLASRLEVEDGRPAGGKTVRAQWRREPEEAAGIEPAIDAAATRLTAQGLDR